jgi:hypothetical protein
MICRKRKILYIHIPRTGGQSIEHILFPSYSFNDEENRDILYGWNDKIGWLNHLTCQEIKGDNYIPDDEFKNYFKFAFVRNPWERLVSEYAWKFPGNFSLFRQYCSDILEERYDRWATGYRDPLAFRQHLREQYKYIYDNQGRLLIDFLGRYENLAVDFFEICKLRSLRCSKLPLYNRSKHKYYTFYYDKVTREIAGRIYREDIKIFNYQFGD